MATFKKTSADEAQSKRKDHLMDTDRGAAIAKVYKAPTSWNGETRSARFVMTAQQADRYGDIVVTAGIDTDEFEKNPVAPLMHNTRAWPVGKWGNIEKILKGRPPRMEGDLILLPAEGPVKIIEETEWMLANGGIAACSIGFIPDWDEVEMILDDDGQPTWGYRFNKSELIECSPCVIPALPAAMMKDINGDMRLARELIEEVLDTWTKTPEGLLVPRAEYEAAHKEVSGNRSSVVVAEEETEEAPAKDAPAEDRNHAEAADALNQSDDDIEAFLAKARKGDTIGVLKLSKEETADKTCMIVICRDGKSIESVVVEEMTDGIFLAIEARQQELDADEAGDAESETARLESIVLPIDTREAEEGLGRVDGMLQGVIDKCAKLFGLGEKNAHERQEPAFEPPPPPSPEAIEAVKAKASETLQRVREKGLV